MNNLHEPWLEYWDKTCLLLSQSRGLGFEAAASGIPTMMDAHVIKLAVYHKALRCQHAKNSIDKAIDLVFPKPAPKIEWQTDPISSLDFSLSWRERLKQQQHQQDLIEAERLISEPFFSEIKKEHQAIFFLETFKGNSNP